MQIEKFDRRPFSVMAVQVSFDNYRDVAEWCKGEVVMQKAKMLGVETEVPAVRIEGQGDNRGKTFIASLGCYIVELKGSFRVYKPAQFESSFVKVEEDSVSQVIEDGCDVCTDDFQHELHVRRMQAEAEHRASDEQGADDNSSVDGQETVSVHIA